MLVSALAEDDPRRAASAAQPMRCWKARRHISAYLDDELPAAGRRAVEEHLAEFREVQKEADQKLEADFRACPDPDTARTVVELSMFHLGRLTDHPIKLTALSTDAQRLRDGLARIDVMPLGSAALAGTTYPIDRAYVAELLELNRAGELGVPVTIHTGDPRAFFEPPDETNERYEELRHHPEVRGHVLEDVAIRGEVSACLRMERPDDAEAEA